MACYKKNGFITAGLERDGGGGAERSPRPGIGLPFDKQESLFKM